MRLSYNHLYAALQTFNLSHHRDPTLPAAHPPKCLSTDPHRDPHHPVVVYNPSFHLIFHFLFHLILHYWVSACVPWIAGLVLGSHLERPTRLMPRRKCVGADRIRLASQSSLSIFPQPAVSLWGPGWTA